MDYKIDFVHMDDSGRETSSIASRIVETYELHINIDIFSSTVIE